MSMNSFYISQFYDGRVEKGSSHGSCTRVRGHANEEFVPFLEYVILF
jgi:hypothetical protein